MKNQSSATGPQHKQICKETGLTKDSINNISDCSVESQEFSEQKYKRPPQNIGTNKIYRVVEKSLDRRNPNIGHEKKNNLTNDGSKTLKIFQLKVKVTRSKNMIETTWATPRARQLKSSGCPKKNFVLEEKQFQLERKRM